MTGSVCGKLRILFLLLAALLVACEQPPLLERIQASGPLKVGTTLSATTYYQGENALAGFEYDLVSAFAESLDIPVEFQLYPSKQALIDALRRDQVHLAAAGLTVNNERANRIAFSTPYQEAVQQLLYRRGDRRPKNLDQLEQPVTIPDSPGLVQKLQTLKQQHPNMEWRVLTGASVDDILQLLNRGEIRYAIADAHHMALSQAFFAHVKPAFNLTGKEELAWGFSRAYDNSLLEAANRFLQIEAESGQIETLQEQYYKDISAMAFVDDRDFWRHVENRLPRYEALFKQAAAQTDLDWRLLAAIGYQESHWDIEAVSPTGVRGIMMLTQSAAKQLQVKDRSNPEESILGGARYVVWKMERIPERIQGKDRLWLGLAAYNIGYGHLEDARVLTERQGGDPDLWEDVKKRLPLLSKEKYYSTLKHGYARGGEPVAYIENIQHYYRLLIWHSNQALKKGDGGYKK